MKEVIILRVILKLELKIENLQISLALFWFHVTFSKKTGIASTTTADDLGSASIMYVKARQAWFIYKYTYRSALISDASSC